MVKREIPLLPVINFYLNRDPNMSLTKLNILIYLTDSAAVSYNQSHLNIIWKAGPDGPYSELINEIAIPYLNSENREQSRFKLNNSIIDTLNQYFDQGFIKLAKESVIMYIIFQKINYSN